MGAILKQSSLQRLFILPFIFLMVCLVLTIGWFLYRAGDDATEVLARNALTEVMGRVSQGIDRQTMGARESLNVVAPPPVPPTEAGQPPATLPFPQTRKELEERLWLANSLFDEPSYVYFGGVDGSFLGIKQEQINVFMFSVREPGDKNYVYYLRGPGIEMKLTAVQDYEPRKRPWYVQAVQQGRETWSPVYADYRQPNVVGINLSKPIFDTDGSLLGVANSSIGLQQLTTLLHQLPLSPNGAAFVTEMKGDMVATSLDESIYQSNDQGSDLLRLNAEHSKSPLVQQAFGEVRRYLSIHNPTPGKLVLLGSRSEGSKIEVAFRLHHDQAGLDWLAISAAPRSDFLGSVTSGVYQTLMLGLLAVCLTFVIGFLLLRWVLRDIRKLTLAAKSIGNGSPFPALNIDRNDEIGQLALSFVEMERNLRTDRLTNVLNRDSLIAQIDFRRRNSSEANPLHFALLFIDLDRFKAVNDEYGHDEGDKVLIAIAERLQHSLRHDDSVARFGGDEFVVYLHGVTDIEVARSIADKIRHAVNKPIEGRDGQQYTVDASVGVSLYPVDGLDVETLLRVADSRMFDQKRLHRILSV
ncbi:sensor domain-containing diguanylate cyclase [Herbaspirillum sp. AP21]|uniref:sensor domain-containing diguanylate cyclase n=1 Tax=Herbaspirillum sp. AP21 TaxID=2754073 RepID=UPI0015DB29FA|nr:sensor domain-containing diguanylate cyclase [Herbaspirillum sp. AP21]NZD68521.1 diguanylate cyclase [Herbaspirillum sp. AP21]